MVISNRKSPNAKRGKRHHESVTVTQPHIDFVLPNFTSSTMALCPDLLTLSDIGVADNMRGRVVRAFFWAMRLWRA